jgi:hypothetical protein
MVTPYHHLTWRFFRCSLLKSPVFHATHPGVLADFSAKVLLLLTFELLPGMWRERWPFQQRHFHGKPWSTNGLIILGSRTSHELSLSTLSKYTESMPKHGLHCTTRLVFRNHNYMRHFLGIGTWLILIYLERWGDDPKQVSTPNTCGGW